MMLPFPIKDLFLFLTGCVGGSAHTSVGAQGVQERVLVPLDLELQVVVTHPTWALGTKLKSSGGAAVFLMAEPSFQSPRTLIYIKWCELSCRVRILPYALNYLCITYHS